MDIDTVIICVQILSDPTILAQMEDIDIEMLESGNYDRDYMFEELHDFVMQTPWAKENLMVRNG